MSISYRFLEIVYTLLSFIYDKLIYLQNSHNFLFLTNLEYLLKFGETNIIYIIILSSIYVIIIVSYQSQNYQSFSKEMKLIK